ncbi:MAG: saccharopine dehydrogenase NADP-binding domain-containing protein [Proteobacteria bacterium]|nr:saccharopine dehydrogenase NADP-binding domain-containing protein [Pseudomonadota bacterium]
MLSGNKGLTVAEQEILVAGAGKIGSLIATLLSETNDYQVHLIDIEKTQTLAATVNAAIHYTVIDVHDKKQMSAYIKQHDIKAVISCLPYFCNVALATLAKESQLHYFDLTEDTETFNAIKSLSNNAATVFVPQCGVAPGFVNIVASHLMKQFHEIKEVLLRVGALPLYPHNALKYALTWSTEGLINQYLNLCEGLVESKPTILQPLGDLESVIIDGVAYEAFNTSGGVGNLVQIFKGKVETLNYKTLRYLGHCKKMRLLLQDFKLNTDRKKLQAILENSLPKTNQDVVIIYVAVNGKQDGDYVEKVFVKKILSQTIAQKSWSAIQVATAASACVVVDLILQMQDKPQGLIVQESISFTDFMNNRFAKFYS